MKVKEYKFENAPKYKRVQVYKQSLAVAYVPHSTFLRLFGYAIIVALVLVVLIQAFGGE